MSDEFNEKISKEDYAEYYRLKAEGDKISEKADKYYSQANRYSDKIVEHIDRIITLINEEFGGAKIEYWSFYGSPEDDVGELDISDGWITYEVYYSAWPKKRTKVMYKGNDLYHRDGFPEELLFLSIYEIREILLEEQEAYEKEKELKKAKAKKKREERAAQKKKLIEAAKTKLTEEEKKALGING
jgi:hypothetical protein